MSGIDTSMNFISINIGLITISDTREEKDDKSGKLLKDRINVLASYICDDFELKEHMAQFNSRINELEYNPNSIALKKSICEELYKNGKYYLD